MKGRVIGGSRGSRPLWLGLTKLRRTSHLPVIPHPASSRFSNVLLILLDPELYRGKMIEICTHVGCVLIFWESAALLWKTIEKFGSNRYFIIFKLPVGVQL